MRKWAELALPTARIMSGFSVSITARCTCQHLKAVVIAMPCVDVQARSSLDSWGYARGTVPTDKYFRDVVVLAKVSSGGILTVRRDDAADAQCKKGHRGQALYETHRRRGGGIGRRAARAPGVLARPPSDVRRTASATAKSVRLLRAGWCSCRQNERAGGCNLFVMPHLVP